MGNAIGLVSTGFVDFIGKLLGHPLDFLAGKSCNNVCGPTWDIICYIENFCLAHLVKLMLVSVLFYFVIVFFYLLKKLGVFYCIFHIVSRIVKSCYSTCFRGLECFCTSLCSVLDNHNQRRRAKREGDIELAVSGSDDSEGTSSYPVPGGEDSEGRHRRRNRDGRRQGSKQEYLSKSLRPRSHRTHVEIFTKNGPSKKRNGNQDSDDHAIIPIHHVRVTRTSKFANKKQQLKHSRQHRRQSSHL